MRTRPLLAILIAPGIAAALMAGAAAGCEKKSGTGAAGSAAGGAGTPDRAAISAAAEAEALKAS